MEDSYVFDNFTGMNTTAARGVLSPIVSRVLRNLRADEEGYLYKTSAPSTIYTPASNTRKITRVVKSGSYSRLIYNTVTSLGGGSYSIGVNSHREDAAGDVVLDATNTVNTSSGWTAAELEDIRYVVSDGVLYWSNPGGLPRVSYDVTTGGTARNMGFAAGLAGAYEPTTPIAVTINAGPGNLKTDGRPAPYRYVYTLVNAEGVESRPSDPTGDLEISDPTGGSIDVEIFGDPGGDAVEGRVYRYGGFNTDGYYLAGTVDVTGAGPYILVDDKADFEVKTVQLPEDNYPPPEGLDVIFLHANRLWGFSSKGLMGSVSANRLWYSGLRRFESWGRVSDATVLSGGFIDLLSPDNDRLLCAASTGSVTILGKDSGVYAMFGDRAERFAFSQRGTTGVASKDALCRAENDVYYVGKDRKVYLVTDKDPVWVSQEIHKSLKDIAQADFDTVKLRFFDGELYVSFQTGSASPDDVAFVLDIVGQRGWRQETGLFNRDIQVLPSSSINNPAAQNELIFVAANGATIKKAYADAASERYVWWKTTEVRYRNAPQKGKTDARISFVEVLGLITNGASSLTNARVYTSTEGQSRSYSIGGTRRDTGYYPSEKVITNFEPDSDVFGQYSWMELKGQLVSLTMQAATMTLRLESVQ